MKWLKVADTGMPGSLIMFLLIMLNILLQELFRSIFHPLLHFSQN